MRRSVLSLMVFFFFKQKTAYEMRISDWSSDVCSSDLVNPRASRTVPFVAKAVGSPIAKIAARVMAGEKLADLPKINRDIAYVAVKEAVFPFARFPGTDPVLSPEMKSTGEVMGIDSNFNLAFAKAQLGAGDRLPTTGRVFV